MKFYKKAADIVDNVTEKLSCHMNLNGLVFLWIQCKQTQA